MLIHIDDVGNRTQRVDQAGTHSYEYDDLYRLTEVTYPGPATTTYTFDAFGNRLTMTNAAGTTDYEYDDADRLTEVDGPSTNPVAYTWDDNGSLTARGSDSFAWDYEERMTSATVNSVTTTFAYRGDGLRDSRTSNSVTTTFTWDVAAGLPVVIDDGPSGKEYVHGAGLEAMVDGSDTYYYLADGLGSTMAIVDDTGTVQKSYTYDVYGKPTATGALANEFDFAGQQTDPSTGLQYLRARYYDPAAGRFMSRDPLAASPNWMGSSHVYVSGNPTNLTDPTGLCEWILPCPVNDERWWCIKNALICGQAIIISQQAGQLAEVYFPSAHGYGVADDLRDAFRHCYWSALLTINFGAGKAKELTDAHERSTPENQTPERERMDQHNNTVGRLIGEYNSRWWHPPGYVWYNGGAAQDCYDSAIHGGLEYLDGPCGDCRDLFPPPYAANFAPKSALLARAIGRRREPAGKFRRGSGLLAGLLYVEIGLLVLVSLSQLLFSLAGGLGPDSDGSARAAVVTAMILFPPVVVTALVLSRAARELLDERSEKWGRRFIVAAGGLNLTAGAILLVGTAVVDLRGVAVSVVPAALFFALGGLLLSYRE